MCQYTHAHADRLPAKAVDILKQSEGTVYVSRAREGQGNLIAPLKFLFDEEYFRIDALYLLALAGAPNVEHFNIEFTMFQVPGQALHVPDDWERLASKLCHITKVFSS